MGWARGLAHDEVTGFEIGNRCGIQSRQTRCGDFSQAHEGHAVAYPCRGRQCGMQDAHCHLGAVGGGRAVGGVMARCGLDAQDLPDRQRVTGSDRDGFREISRLPSERRNSVVWMASVWMFMVFAPGDD